MSARCADTSTTSERGGEGPKSFLPAELSTSYLHLVPKRFRQGVEHGLLAIHVDVEGIGVAFTASVSLRIGSVSTLSTDPPRWVTGSRCAWSWL
jgi:hypothetical protein